MMAVIASFLHACAPLSKESEERKMAREKYAAGVAKIEAHMKRYGINRDDMAALKRLDMEYPFGNPTDMKLASAKFYQPGEHYRFEMEGDYILTMKVPEGKPDTNWIWPYTDIHDPDMKQKLSRSYGSLMVADLGWYTRHFPGTIEDRNSKGVSIIYWTIKPEEEEKYTTPEKMQAYLVEEQRRQIHTQADVEKEARRNPVSIWVPTWFVLKPEQVVINGRVWIRYGISDTSGRPKYSYYTVLRPGRKLRAMFGLPRYKYLDALDPLEVLALPVYADPRAAASSYPEPIREAIARMDEMVASLRIAKIKDDGAPDPFVIKRGEPAPLPVREPLPAAKP